MTVPKFARLRGSNAALLSAAPAGPQSIPKLLHGTSSKWAGIACAILAISATVNRASADSITLDGSITQSTFDGTGPAANNSSLNNIADGDAYSVTIDFLGSLTSAGHDPLSLVTMSFNDPAAGASETSFNSASVTVSADGSLFDISILGCLSTGSGCVFGNQLDANFSIPMAGLNAHGIAAAAIAGLVPSMNLLEDDGITGIQGSIAGYDYSGSVVASTPEPSELALLGAALAGIILTRRERGAEQL